MREGVAYGTLLDGVSIHATDLDGGVITYSIQDNSCSQNYTIENIFLMSISGEIFVTALDRELTPTCTLTVLAFDGRHYNSATVSIIVDDINDNTPYFVDIQQANVTNASSPDPFYRVSAFDDDIGVNGQFIFTHAGPDSDR